ncbi:MAG: DJ-1 family glyoxalase III [Thermodesulfobacteriota bacterium]
MKRVLVALAPGFEEVEALTVVDILRRAGAEVTVAGTAEGLIEGRSRIRVAPDRVLDEGLAAEGFDMLVLPGGGPGTENLKKNALVLEMVRRLDAQGAFVAAICAATTVLSEAGVTAGRRMTGHPTVWDRLKAKEVSTERVVADGNLITSQGAGTAMEFAFRLAGALFGPRKAEEVNRGVLARV